MENKCCEKFHKNEDIMPNAECLCLCHTSPKEEPCNHGDTYKDCYICSMPSPKEECSDKDDMFARTNEGDGYMQCQVHLRNSIKCDRLHKHLISSPKVSEWEEKLMDKFCVMFERAERDNSTTDWVSLMEQFILSLLSSTEKRVAMEKDNELKQRVGILRQWLNEDRITDPSKLVENEDLLSWLIKSKYE